MANYACRNGHTWKGKSNLSHGFHPGELNCKECGERADPKLKQSASRNGVQAVESDLLAEAHERFSDLVTESPCFLADRIAGRPRRPDHRCWPANHRDPHHLVPASWIKATFRDLPDVDLADILYAPIIGAPLCRVGHEAVEARTDFIYWHELDDEAKEFCRQVDEKYPGRPSMLARLELESPTQTEGFSASTGAGAARG